MENRTELVCYVTRGEEAEEYRISLSYADFTAEEFIELLVEPIMLAQAYHPDSVKEALGKIEYKESITEEMWRRTEIAGEMSKL